MTEWRKPEIVDLDVKFTETLTIDTSGDGKQRCPECGHPINHPEDFNHNGNHKDGCSFESNGNDK